MIHVSLVRTDIDDMLVARMVDALSPAERARAARFRHLADRRRHVVARTVLKGLLAERLGCEVGEVTVVSGVHGKPSLAEGRTNHGSSTISPDAPLHFNLSHSGDLALIALAPVPVGIDLERDTPTDAETLAQWWFTPAEQARLACGEDDFLTLWTGREAVLKAEGIGLSANPQAFSLPPLSSSPPLASLTPMFISPPFAAVRAAPWQAAFDGYLVARLALGSAMPCQAGTLIPPALIAPYRAAIALRGSALPVVLACTDAARFALRATLAAVAPASADAVCLPH